MPKQNINYSNTVIYKIINNDVTVADCYVGSTTNFIQRKQVHKSTCHNATHTSYNSNVYKVIRDFGGWENWSMLELEKYPCKDKNEATLRERHWVDLLSATLNTNNPNNVNTIISSVSQPPEICKSNPVLFDLKDNNKTLKQCCLTCLEKHPVAESKNNPPPDKGLKKTIECLNCDKTFQYRSGLSRHKKKCELETATTSVINPEIIMNIIYQNSEFKEMLMEQSKQTQEQNNEFQKQILELCKNTSITNNTNNMINTNNSHNKTFNLQFFLNDTCKNAMNLGDFVSSLQIDIADLESVGELGFVNGLSKLIINGLNDLEECERPVHCSDLKRESMYVKEDNKWEKEDAENTKMKKALKQIAHKNIKMLPVWKAKNPDYKRSESHLSDKYSHMVIEAMGGSGDNDEEKANKIIRKIAKEVTIKKQS